MSRVGFVLGGPVGSSSGASLFAPKLVDYVPVKD